MLLTPGTRLGQYQIRGPLGAGGMSEVYRAHDPRLGRDVALKILPQVMAQDPSGLARFAREARAVAALNHPHIVTIFSTEEIDGLRFITMELIEGRTLARVIPKGGLDLSQFFAIAQAIADALAAAHSKQITHRDLKPANIMVTDTGRVKVLDFGLARGGESEGSGSSRGQDETTRQRVTETGVILGTVPYMSPEQVEALPLDPRSDIFSFGVVMYEMATGRRPFRGASPPALMAAILREHPISASELRPALPREVSALMARCLAKNPRDRVQNAGEALLNLKLFQKTWESGPSPPTETPAGAATLIYPSRQAAELFRGASPNRHTRTRPGSIAIDRFLNPGAEREMESLAHGLGEDLAVGLARFPYITVLRPEDPAARYIIEGSVRHSAGSVRANVRLVDREGGAHLWAQTFDRSLAGRSLFDLQDDLTSHTVTAVAEADGALVRSLAFKLKDRPLGQLSVDELALRHLVYTHNVRADEHLRLRGAFERALGEEADHAFGWACLSFLYEQEHSLGLNARPQSRNRAQKAAEKSVEIDVSCQAGWRAIAARHYFDRDPQGLRLAADRALALNPLNTDAVAYLGMILAFSGDWERGVALVHRALELNPRHPGWFHHVLFADHYRRSDYEGALIHAQRSDLNQFVWSPLAVASAAGQLGRAADARAAIESLQKNHPHWMNPENIRAHWALWLWDKELIERLIQGFNKSRALVTPEPIQARQGRPPSIAVLLFTDTSDARNEEWFSEGVADGILSNLAAIPGLRVAPRESAFSFKGKTRDLRSIGEKLRVGTLLLGSCRIATDRMRLTVQLNDAHSGDTLWLQRYERWLSELFEVQDEVAKEIAERLRVSLPGSSERRLVAGATKDIEAHLTCLRARSLSLKRGRRLLPALDQFQRVVDRDSEYGAAWIGMADVLALLGYYGLVRAADVGSRALKAAEHAVALQPDSSQAHHARACVQLLYGMDVHAADSDFKKALELDPGNGPARCSYAFWFLQLTHGRLDEGVAEARGALELDPYSMFARTILGACLGVAGRHDQALTLLRGVAEGDPEALLPRHVLGLCLGWAGKLEESATVLEGAARMSGYSGFATSSRTMALCLSGRRAEGQDLYRQMQERAGSEYVSVSGLAEASFAVGDRDQAVSFAQRACDEREPQFVLFSRHAPHYAWLRDQPEWPAMLKRLDEPPPRP